MIFLLFSSWIINEFLKYYLKHVQECFIRYKQLECFISDKARTAYLCLKNE